MTCYSYKRSIYVLAILSSITLQPIHAYFAKNVSFSLILWIYSSSPNSISSSRSCSSPTITPVAAFSAIKSASIQSKLQILRHGMHQQSKQQQQHFTYSQRYHLPLHSLLSQDKDISSSSHEDRPNNHNLDKSNKNDTMKNELFDEYSNEPIQNSIPPIQHLSTLTNLEQEFYTMMKEFTLYTPNDISSIPNPSYRALYNGVLAGSTEPKVMNAFAIIFNDLLPIRIAGRMIYKHLRNVMEDHRNMRQQENQNVQIETGLSMDAIETGRKMFMIALNSNTNNNSEQGDNGDDDDDNKRNKNKKGKDEGKLTMTELINSGIVDTIVELMQYESFDEFVKRMEQDEDEKITFERFMIGLQKCALMKNVPIDNDRNNDGSDNIEYDDDGMDKLCDVSCDLEEVLFVTAQRMAPIEAMKNQMTVSQRKQKHSDRYDEMVQTFEEWETIIGRSEGEGEKKMGRMGQVLSGCFAGAKNERIVYALKIVYMDYSALRVGGDLVFKLMSKLVSRRK